MKAAIEVKNRQEAELIGHAMSNPNMKVLILVLGALSSIPHDAALKVLQTAKEQFEG